MQIPVLFILLAVCGTQQGASIEVPGDEEIATLVAQLGDQKFVVRQAATKRLRELGRVAIPALRTAKDKGRPEVRARAEAILSYVLGTVARETFLKDPTVANGGKIPGWERLRGLVASDELAVQQLRDWLTAEPRLFETRMVGGRELADHLRQRSSRLTNYQREKLSKANVLNSVTAILFVAADPQTELSREGRAAVESIFEIGLTRQAMSPTAGNHDVLRKLTGQWIGLSGSQYQKLILSLKYALPEGLPLAETIVRSKARGPRMEYALHLIGKLGGEPQKALLRSQLDDKTRLSPRNVAPVVSGKPASDKDSRRRQLAFQYQVRDIALAMLWHLHGENPARHGFDPKRVVPHTWYVFKLGSMGFTSDTQREAAFAEWRRFEATKSAK